VTGAEVQELQRLFSESGASSIAYERLSEAFTCSYFEENFWKTATVLQDDVPPLARRIVDAGCGSGASLLAYLCALDGRLDQPWEIQVLLVDRCPQQLRLAEQIMSGHKVACVT
jgi:methylase of polypeptide subunit release factors